VDTQKKLATATQLQLSRNVTDFNQATAFQITTLTLKKLTFEHFNGFSPQANNTDRAIAAFQRS
jgi:hypothetical protein